MRLVVDTNVFVSAAIKQSSWPAEVLRWIVGYDGLLKSSVTEREVIEVLQRPRIAPKIAPLFVANVRDVLADAELVASRERVHAAVTRKTTSSWSSPSTATPM